jgi:hypothetical protein
MPNLKKAFSLRELFLMESWRLKSKKRLFVNTKKKIIGFGKNVSGVIIHENFTLNSAIISPNIYGCLPKRNT